MALIVGLKNENKILFIFGLLLLTVEVISGENSLLQANSLSDVGVQLKQRPMYENHPWSSNEKGAGVMDFVMFPIPEIIAKLACLEGASMQKQLNSALSWPTELPKINETIQSNEFDINITSIIKNPLNFRETWKQINQQLNKTLKTINTTTDEIISKMHEAQIVWQKTIKWFEATHALSHHLIHYQELETFIKLISEQLNDLKNASDLVVLLFNPISAELEEMANLIKLFAEAVYDIQSVKQDYAKSALKKELNEKTNLKSKLKKEVTLLKKENKQFEYKKAKNLVKLEKKLYRYLYYVRKHNKNPKVLSCLENTVKNLNAKEDFYVTCGSKSASFVERKKLKEVEIAKLTLQTILQALIKNKNNLKQKEEEHRNILLTVKILEKTKTRMDQDIMFLDNTTKLVDELENQMEELIFNGWMKLASLCEDIQSDVPKVKASILSLRFVNLRSFEKILQQTKQQLLKTDKKMSLVGRILSVYVLAYETDLDSLLGKLELMMNSKTNLAKLEENLISACNNTSRELEIVLAKLKLEDKK